MSADVTVRVHLLRSPGEDSLRELRGLLDPGIGLTSGEPPPSDFEILVAGRPKRDHLQGRPSLKSLVIPFAGIPPETRELLRHFPGIRVHNLHYNDRAVAEMAVALLLAAAKRILPADRALRRNDWSERDPERPSLQLEGRTALVLGFGAIGREVGRRLKGLGLRVVAVRRKGIPGGEPEADEVHPTGRLRELLPRADCLMICVPATEETKGMIGRGELEALPLHAVLVNIARGGVIDEEALYEALRARRIFAAGLDVWYRYPKGRSEWPNTAPSDFPFHELDNVVMSPHRASMWEGMDSVRMKRLAELLNPAARAKPLANPVDLAAGY